MIKVFTDTDTDITLSEANELNLGLISMPYIVEGNPIYPFVDYKEYDYKTFYNLLSDRTLNIFQTSFYLLYRQSIIPIDVQSRIFSDHFPCLSHNQKMLFPGKSSYNRIRC